MKYIFLIMLATVACSAPKDSVDEFDRLDLANTVDTTRGTYHPRVDSTYYYPSDSSDIVSVAEYSDYQIETIIFPVIRKYIVQFVENSQGTSKVYYRDYKLQIRITDEEGLSIKKVITKYDIPDSLVGPNPRYDFIREAKFIEFKNNEFRIDIVLNAPAHEGGSMVKCYVSLLDSIRFEGYPEQYYDSLYGNWEL